MPANPGPFQLLHDEPPPGATLHRELHLAHPGVAGQEPPHRRPARRPQLTPTYLPRLGVQHIERDLSTVHIERPYDGHQSLLTLLKLIRIYRALS